MLTIVSAFLLQRHAFQRILKDFKLFHHSVGALRPSKYTDAMAQIVKLSSPHLNELTEEASKPVILYVT